jgi:hypothetical protein
MSVSMFEYRQAVRGHAPYAPGADYLLMSDGGVCCLECGYTNRRDIVRAITTGAGDGWRVDAVCNTYNTDGLDALVSCDVCGTDIQTGKDTE